MNEVETYRRIRNLKLAAAELGIPWQTLYVRLKKAGEPVTGDKLRYGNDRDKLSATAEAEFLRLVPKAKAMNAIRWQSKHDFEIGKLMVDVKASMPRQLNKKYAARSWSFSFKKQSMTCDFICCFCFDDDRSVRHILLVPSEFFTGLQTVSVSCGGQSKWLDYSIKPQDLAPFFKSLSNHVNPRRTT